MGIYPLQIGDVGQIRPVGIAGKVPDSLTGQDGRKFPHEASMGTLHVSVTSSHEKPTTRTGPHFHPQNPSLPLSLT